MTWFYLLTQTSVIACALVAGVFLSFSDFVMKSLGSTQATGGAEVMQAINRDVFRSIFIVLLLSMSALAPFMVGFAHYHLTGLSAMLIAGAGLIYFFGVYVVTVACNVPMNKRLDAAGCAGEEAARYWTRIYQPRWTFWNTIRTIAAAVSAVGYLLGSAGL